MTTNEFSCRARGCRWLWRIPLIVLAVVLVKSAVALLLWNALVPELFHGPVLRFPQMVGLLILAKLVVGFGPHGPHRHGPPPWARWAHMSPEDRMKLRDELKKSSTEPTQGNL